MSFVSTDFLLFLTVVLATFYALPQRHRNTLLLAASYFFYGYWSVKYLCLLIFTMVVDYFVALLIDRAADDQSRKRFLVVSLVINLGILFLFKYLNFFSDLVAVVTSGRRLVSVDLVLPFGISFYTFHAMSYVIDVYRRVLPAERSFVHYSGYVMFFPQLVAGPIARASHLLHQFAEPKFPRREKWIEGSWLIAKGFFMKMVIADKVAPAVDAYFHFSEAPRTAALMTQAVYFFAFQIYCDFAGYTEIARGVAKLFDYELVVNFERPYSATSITDFWRRWHISLSTWLRDYLYISLGGNRRGEWRTYRNLMLTMLLGGLWHGANLTFVVWGGAHGLLLSIEKFAQRTRWRTISAAVPTALKRIVTFQLVCLTWIPFRAENVHSAGEITRSFLHFWTHPRELEVREIDIKLWFLIATWMTFEWAEARFSLRDRFSQASTVVRYAALYAAILAIVLFAETNPKAFIYFQF